MRVYYTCVICLKKKKKKSEQNVSNWKQLEFLLIGKYKNRFIFPILKLMPEFWILFAVFITSSMEICLNIFILFIFLRSCMKYIHLDAIPPGEFLWSPNFTNRNFMCKFAYVNKCSYVFHRRGKSIWIFQIFSPETLFMLIKSLRF